MEEPELGVALEWAAAEGWNPGLNDRRCFWAADPGGFFLAELDGEAVGSVSAVRYGSDFAFLGLYIVRSDLRGRGIGQRMWVAALDHLRGRTVGLDGVPAQGRTTSGRGLDAHTRTFAIAARASHRAAQSRVRSPWQTRFISRSPPTTARSLVSTESLSSGHGSRSRGVLASQLSTLVR